MAVKGREGADIWEEVCGTCNHALFSSTGREYIICKQGKFKEFDVFKRQCPHKKEGMASYRGQNLVRLSFS